MKRTLKRSVCFLLILCCLLQTVVLSPIAAAQERAADSSTHHGNFAIDGISIDYESSLLALQDGRFYLSLTMTSASYEVALNTHVRMAENGTYRVSKEGWYLIELWGGKGADGGWTP